MPDEPSWPTVDGDEVPREPPTVQVRRPDPPTMRIPAPVPPPPAAVPPRPAAPTPRPPRERSTEIKPEPEPVPGPITESEGTPPPAPPARRRKRPYVLALAALLVLALAGTAVVGAQRGWFDRTPAATTAAAPPPAPVALSVKGIGADGAAPTAAGVKAALTGPAANPLLAPLTGVVVDPGTGQALWNQGEKTPATPASTTKVLVSAAALLSLDHTAQFSTKVVRGAQPGTVVLVGGGDPTLSSLPVGDTTVYPGAPTLDELVAQVKATGPVTQVLFDASRYTGEGLAPGWAPGDVPDGYVSPIQPVMLDGGRGNPKLLDTRRTSTPAADAASALAQRLGATAAVAPGTAAAGAEVLGEVKSAPVDRLVENLMQNSDNVLAETMAREIAIARGAEPSFAGGAQAVRDVLTQHGFDLATAVFVDGSGLSPNNKLPAKLLADILTAAAKPDASDERTAKLRPLLTALPVAGGSGTLATRFQEAGASAKGWARGKTGTLSGVHSLAGVVVDADGRLVVFAFMSQSTQSGDAVRGALDEMVAALRACGC
ncbi:D-alanyl-D-alanine carboxypeptidase/D-alanyl-D-alanine-endopeptidase [Saccharothrix longispora]|uniref:D-alanyl-D-alanine carboxypeptidase/D-alanyl-D-alanine endopeptidase n=1 Tax=Saccharothrix longispora TaxID=33920 RepID=UPI0028FD2D4B|nr:D-alanyl-D-alanine carboxypeptidase/D-alanyl-D-alanine-endopeptidase [Saccharothrix longispora]MDU0292807.1 D-alanyl-D-alanine carboxypeptidase/D-alanyl-D-alanine-endopeptidase [Saccharothrix longispora]